MKKAVILLLVVAAITLASCNKNVCPAYADENTVESVENQG